ncbi:serpin-ZX-like [Rosa rugosa]|uniref:serpin-ZX-like n=1 Tax=Rosa rugosa TaxID=74645 RepID=UPI002B40B93A|nr:serpin-ZX-like [Rosa rugosa]
MDLQQAISNQTDVGLEITKHLLRTDFKEKNMPRRRQTAPNCISLFLSSNPIPATTYLNFLAYNLLTSVLADASAAGGPCLNLANGLWVDRSHQLDESYVQVVCNYYKAALKQADFKSNPDGVRIEVNSWVNQETNGLIPEILPPNSVTPNTYVILANTLYFKASWCRDYFNASRTRNGAFHLLNGNSVYGVPYMTSCFGGCHSISAFDGFKVLNLAYKGSSDYKDHRCFSMHLLLPDARDGLPALVERVCTFGVWIFRSSS